MADGDKKEISHAMVRMGDPQIITYSLKNRELSFHDDRLILRNKKFHYRPTSEIGNCTYTEDNHVSSRFAFKTHEGKSTALACRIIT